MTAKTRTWYDDLQWRDAHADYMDRREWFDETGLRLDLLKVQDTLLGSDLALHFRDAMATITADGEDGRHSAGSLILALLSKLGRISEAPSQQDEVLDASASGPLP